MSRYKKRITDEELIIAYNLRRTRDKKFGTIREAAEGIGLHQSHWSQWESALVTPRPAKLKELAEYLKVNADDTPEDFSRKPDNWDEIRGTFIERLRKRANSQKLKDLYLHAIAPKDKQRIASKDKQRKESVSSPDDDIHILMLKMYELVNHARKRAEEGDISPEQYDDHMKTLTGIISVSMFGKEKSGK